MYQTLVTEIPFLGYWLTPVICYVLLAYGVLRWLQKKIIDGDSSSKEEKDARAGSAVFFSKRLFIQFWTTLVIAACFVLVRMLFGVKVAFTSDALIITGIGFINYFGAYNQWRAMSISLSKSSLLTFGDDLGAMALDAMFLGGLALLNFWSATGALIACFALVLFGLNSWQKKEPMQLYKHVAYFSVIWAVANFAQRYYALGRFPVEVFLMCWYSGAFLGALANMIFVRLHVARKSISVSYADVGRSMFIAPAIVCLVVLVTTLAGGVGHIAHVGFTSLFEHVTGHDLSRVIPFYRVLLSITAIGVGLYALRVGSTWLSMLTTTLWGKSFPQYDATSLRLLDVQGVGFLGLGIIACLAIMYWALSLATLLVVAPILLVSEAIIPTLVGIFIFKEKGQFSKVEWGYATLAIMGVLYIAVGYH